jgi:hypothetical protein
MARRQAWRLSAQLTGELITENNMVDVTSPNPTSPPMPGPAQTPPTPQQSGGSFGNSYSDRPIVQPNPDRREQTK